MQTRPGEELRGLLDGHWASWSNGKRSLTQRGLSKAEMLALNIRKSISEKAPENGVGDKHASSLIRGPAVPVGLAPAGFVADLADGTRLVVMVVLLFGNVTLRHLFNSGINASDEVSCLAFPSG